METEKNKNMKTRHIFAAMLCALTISSCSCSAKRNAETPAAGEAAQAMKSFKGTEEIVRLELSGPPLGIGKLFLKETPAKEVSRGIRKINILSAEDGNDAQKSAVTERMDSVLKNYELLLSANDGEDAVEIYSLSKDSDSLRELVIYVRDEATVVALNGSIALNDLSAIMEED